MLSARLALTLKHPWPFAVCHMGKRIENRSWLPGARLSEGEWFFIHGGRVPMGEALEDLADIGRWLLRTYGVPPGWNDVKLFEVVACKGLVAAARFGGAVTKHDSPWFEGPYGWVLSEVVVLPEPVPCKGAQGLWTVPPEPLAAARAQLETLQEQAAMPTMRG